jgi:TPR repeat protein
MKEYCEFRERVFRASDCAESEEQFFNDRLELSADDVAGFTALKERANGGDLQALVMVGMCFCTGRGTPKNPFTAAEYWMMAANKGNGRAMYYGIRLRLVSGLNGLIPNATSQRRL